MCGQKALIGEHVVPQDQRDDKELNFGHAECASQVCAEDTDVMFLPLRHVEGNVGLEEEDEQIGVGWISSKEHSLEKHREQQDCCDGVATMVKELTERT